MSNGRLEALITVPTGGWTGTIDDSGGGGAAAWTIAAGTYYLGDLITALSDALNTAATTDTLTVAVARGENGTGKTSITSTGNGTLAWTSTDCRDVFGYAGNVTLTASVASVSDYQCRSLWIASCAYNAPNQIQPWLGWIETDGRSSESPGGSVFSLTGRNKQATWLRWEATPRARASQANESTVNESFERFVRDGVWGFAAWGTPGGPIKFYPDADQGDWVEYAVNLSEFNSFKPEHWADGWAGGPWRCGFERLVMQDASGTRADPSPVLLTSGSSTTDGTSVATSSIAPASSTPLYAGILHQAASAINQPTLTGCGLTWSVVASAPYSTNTRRLTVFEAIGSPTPGALTFDFGGQTQTSFCWSVVQVNDGATSSPTLQSDTTDTGSVTTVNATLPNALEDATNIMLVFVGHSANEATTPDAQFAELSDDSINAGNLGLEVEWAQNQTTCDPTWATAAGSAIVALECKSGVQ